MNHSTLVTYVDEIRHYMNLSHWEVEVVITSTEDLSNHDPFVEVVKVKDRPLATILFPQVVLDYPLEEIRHYIVHELLHLHIQRLWRHIESLQPLIGVFSYATFSEAARADMEEMVDRLTYIIEPLIPLLGKELG